VTTEVERVAEGAAFLDEHDPDWWRADVDRAIDLGALALADPVLCVLGQRCPLEVLSRYADHFAEGDLSAQYWRSYFAYAHELSAIDKWDGLTEWAAPLGFQAAAGDYADDEANEVYASLTAEWKRLITERREAGAQ